MRVLFVCLGNICRSPTAEGVLRGKLEQAGLADRVEVDSAGTAGWHIGKAPDPRTCQAAAKRGYDLSALRARQVSAEDFQRFDLVLAMDHSNLRDLKALHAGRGNAPTCSCAATAWPPRKCPIPTTAGKTASRPCSTWWSRPATA